MKQKSTVSEMLVALRRAMGKTQQEFAVQDLECAISTLARYETSDPPRGGILLKLAEIADENHLPELAEAFRAFFADEMLEGVGEGIKVASGIGRLLLKLNTPEEMAAAQRFMREIEVMRGDREKDFVHPFEEQFDALMRTKVGRKRRAK